jgi:cell division septum initiation protein DivIVA
MTSIPQLRKDINDLQEKNRELRARIAELESAQPKVIRVPVPGPERIVYRDRFVTEYRDNPDHIEMIRKLKAKQNA